MKLFFASIVPGISRLLAQVTPPLPGAPDAEPGAEPPAGLEIEPLLSSERLFDPEMWQQLIPHLLRRLIDYLPSLFAALLVLAFFLVLARAVERLLGRMVAHSRVDPGFGQVALPLVRYAILVLGLIMAASQAGLQVGSLLAGVGIVGLAIGLAAQDSLANVVAGLTILWDRPFRVGDRVTVADRYGQVVQVGLRSTRLRTLEQLDVILPNQEVIKATIVNHTLTPDLRLGVPLSISYKEDTREARRVLLAAVTDDPGIKAEPAPEVVVTRLADSGVELELRAWLKDPASERASLFRLLEIAKIALDEAGIEIPFPQRTLHFDPGGPPLRLVTEPPREGDDEPPVAS